LLGSEARRLQVVIEETEAIKQAYGTPRRTVILDDREQAAGMAARMATAVAADLDKPQGPQVVALTTRGVVRTDAAKFSYRVKEGVLSRAVEAHLSRFTLEPEDSLLLVSNLGRVWKAGAGMVPRKASFAELGLNKGEILVGGGVVVPDVYLVIGTRAGNIKRVGVDELKMGEASWAEIIGLSGQGDEVLFAGLGSEQAEVMFFTASGKANRFIAAQVNPQATPSARGVVGVKVAKGDRLVAGSVFEPDNKRSVVVVVSETGYGKQVKLSAFPVQGRGGQGVQSLELTKATGRVAAAVVTPDGVQFCDVLSAQGLRQRVALDKLPAVDRRKGGEQVVAFEKDDLIRAVALF
jgi:DNA gyrase/topoisomerase IV subunit A